LGAGVAVEVFLINKRGFRGHDYALISCVKRNHA